MITHFDYDAIVVGAGHAGTEAAHALAHLGKHTLMLCLNLDKIANLPCNPTIGGSAKGIVVREIDALGGIEGKLADRFCLQMKVLNMSKGPGVRSLRAQEDKLDYPHGVRDYMLAVPNLDIKVLMATDLIEDDDGSIKGVILEDGTRITAKAVVLTTGTHMESTILRGHVVKSGGPDGERPSHGISAALERLGIKLERLKTGTPPRIKRESIDFSKLEVEKGTPGFWAFSYDTTQMIPYDRMVDCYLTYTTPVTHKIILDHLKDSAMYGGVVKGIGPRYCPSIEDKVVRFRSHPRHMLFVEPESIHTDSIYLQGFSTSMPEDIQVPMVHSLPGFEHAEFLKYAYAIEYDAIQPLQITKGLMVRNRPGLFAAGQIIGTSGYEEAAGLGLMAGINAARYIDGKEPFTLRRDEAYIGVMIDDLVTKGSNEPYRLLSSRSEYRLITRSDNADERLMKHGYEIGLNSKERYDRFLDRMARLKFANQTIESTYVGNNERTDQYMISLGYPKPVGSISYKEIIRRKDVSYQKLTEVEPKLVPLTDDLADKLETDTKYEGYIALERRDVERVRSYDDLKLPKDIDYSRVEGLSLEAREKLNKFKPETLGDASRIINIHPADIDMLLFFVRKLYSQQSGNSEGQQR